MDTLVKIDLPLPLDVSATLLRAVGTMYPNTRLVTDADPYKMVIAVSDSDREAVNVADELEGFDELEITPKMEDVEALLSSLKDGSFGMNTPEWFSKMMIGAVEAILEDTTAENYLEMTLRSQDGRSYAVVLCRDERTTPHTLRKEADERADRYASKLRELGIDPDTI